MLCVFGNKVLSLHQLNLRNFTKPNQYKNADIIIIVFAINGKQRTEGADGTDGFYSPDS